MKSEQEMLDSAPSYSEIDSLRLRSIGRMKHRSEERPRLVVAGGGPGGLAAVRSLRFEDIDIVWVRSNFVEISRSQLIKIAKGEQTPFDEFMPFGDITSGFKDFEIMIDRVLEVDLGRQFVETERGGKIEYDFLVLTDQNCEDAQLELNDREFVFDVKIPSSASRINQIIQTWIEEVKREKFFGDSVFKKVVVVGAGPLGVEWAGQLAEFFNGLSKSVFGLKRNRIIVELVEKKSHILPGFSARVRRACERELKFLGVSIVCSENIEKITDDRFCITDDSVISADLVIRTDGTHSSRYPKLIGSRELVTSLLTLWESDSVFLVGAKIIKEYWKSSLGSYDSERIRRAEGRYIGKSIRTILSGGEPRGFKFRSHLSMFKLSSRMGVICRPGISITGMLPVLVLGLFSWWARLGFSGKIRRATSWFRPAVFESKIFRK